MALFEHGVYHFFLPKSTGRSPLDKQKNMAWFQAWGESHSPRKFKRTGCFNGGKILSALSASRCPGKTASRTEYLDLGSTLWQNNITMGNHHFWWENSLFLWPFSIAMLVYQGVQTMVLWICPTNPLLLVWIWSAEKASDRGSDSERTGKDQKTVKVNHNDLLAGKTSNFWLPIFVDLIP